MVQSKKLCTRQLGIGLLIAVLLFLGVMAFKKAPSAPEKTVLLERATRSIELGWSLLRVQNMTFESGLMEGDAYIGTFTYTVQLHKPYAELEDRAKTRIATFLPECASFFQLEASCAVREKMVFIFYEPYGWVPALFVQHRPELLDAVVVEKGKKRP